MALGNVDDQWRPSLAPIRTTALSSARTPPSGTETYHTKKQQLCSHGGFKDCKKKPPLTAKSSTPYTASPASNRPSDPSCCHFQHSSFDLCRSNCFPCLGPSQASTTPRSRRCRSLSGRIRRRRLHLLRSWTFLLPAGGRMQSVYSSTPTASAQFSGSFHRSPSGKIDHFLSPPTSSVQASLTSQLSRQFSSPKTPASSKVQHFSGAFPSPRTPYSPSLVASPSTRQKRANFTLAMPAGTMNRKNGIAEITDEPSSPHVTCIGRVRQKTQCKKILLSDTVHCRTQRHRLETKARKEEIGNLRKEKNIASNAPAKHTSNMQPTESETIEEMTALKASTQTFSNNKLLSLDKGIVSAEIPHKSYEKTNDDLGLHDVDGGKEDDNGEGLKMQSAKIHNNEADRCISLMRSTRSRRFSEDEIGLRRSPSINDNNCCSKEILPPLALLCNHSLSID